MYKINTHNLSGVRSLVVVQTKDCNDQLCMYIYNKHINSTTLPVVVSIVINDFFMLLIGKRLNGIEVMMIAFRLGFNPTTYIYLYHTIKKKWHWRQLNTKIVPKWCQIIEFILTIVRMFLITLQLLKKSSDKNVKMKI